MRIEPSSEMSRTFMRYARIGARPHPNSESLSVAHLEAARTWAQKDVSPTDTSVEITEETSTAFCYYCEYAPCNVVLQVEHDVKGTSANLRVGDPALKVTVLGRTSISRLILRPYRRIG